RTRANEEVLRRIGLSQCGGSQPHPIFEIPLRIVNRAARDQRCEFLRAQPLPQCTCRMEPAKECQPIDEDGLTVRHLYPISHRRPPRRPLAHWKPLDCREPCLHLRDPLATLLYRHATQPALDEGPEGD